MTFKSIHNKFLAMPLSKYILLSVFTVFMLSILSYEPFDSTFIALHTLDKLNMNAILKGIITLPVLLLNLYFTIKLFVALPLWLMSLPFKKWGDTDKRTLVQLLGCLTIIMLLLVFFTDSGLYDLVFQFTYALIIYYTYLLFKQRKELKPFWATLIILIVPSIMLYIPTVLNL